MAFGENRKLHHKHKFVVLSLRFGSAAFQKMSELKVEAAKIEYYEGGSNIPIKDAGRLTFSDVTLERGSSSDMDMYNWFLQTSNAAAGPGGSGLVSPQFKSDDLAVTQRDRDNTRIREWQLTGAFPLSFTAGDWDNTADEVVIEQLMLAYDYFTPTF